MSFHDDIFQAIHPFDIFYVFFFIFIFAAFDVDCECLFVRVYVCLYCLVAIYNATNPYHIRAAAINKTKNII